MATGIQATRYPDFKPQDMKDPNELSKKLSELTRAIDDKDKRQPNPYDIYGKTITIDSTNLTFEGISIDGFYTWSFTIDRDVGTCFINFPEQETKELITIYLPNSRYVEGRSIAFSVKTTSIPNMTAALNISVAPGSDNEFVYTGKVDIPVTGTIEATITDPSVSYSLNAPSDSNKVLFVGAVVGSTWSPLYLLPTSGVYVLSTIDTGNGRPGVLLNKDALPVGGTITLGDIDISLSSNLKTSISPSFVGTCFEVRAYFNKWLMITKI